MTDSFVMVYMLSTLTLSAPLILASMGGLLSERSGIINIGLEGKMLGSAVAAAVVGAHSGSAWWGLAAGILAGLALSLLHWLMTQFYRIDHIISGMAINAIAFGSSNFLDRKFLDPDDVGKIPVLPVEPYYILAFLLPVVLWQYLMRTRGGLRLLAVGENPDKSRQMGVEPGRIRLSSLAGTGVLCGLAGVLFVSQFGRFVDNMTAGNGFIALAALILGGWRPIAAALACLGFGAFQALQLHLQGTKVLGADLPAEVWQSLPYLATVIALAGLLGSRSKAPSGLGKA